MSRIERENALASIEANIASLNEWYQEFAAAGDLHGCTLVSDTLDRFNQAHRQLRETEVH